MSFMNKTYKFSYGGTLKKVLSKLIMFITNFVVIIFSILIMFVIFYSLNNSLEKLAVNIDVLNVIKWVETALCVIIVAFFIIQPFLPQKVEIQGNIIKVYRHCLISPFRGFNDTILINNIKEICLEEDKNLIRISPIMPVAIIDWENLVKIEMETGKSLYYIPVENSNDFVEEVNKRRQSISENDINKN